MLATGVPQPGALARRVERMILTKCGAAGYRSCRYGSEALGLAIFSSDIDVAILPPPSRPGDDQVFAEGTRRQREWALRQVAAGFEAAPWATAIELRSSAKVPLVRLAEASTGIEVDVTLASDHEKSNTTPLVFELTREHPPGTMLPLALVLKVFLEQAALNTPYLHYGSLNPSSFPVIHCERRILNTNHLTAILCMLMESAPRG